jgi:hypothetical protein
MSCIVQYNFKNLYINNNKFYNIISKSYSGTLFNKPSLNVEGPPTKPGLKSISFNSNLKQYMTTSPFYTINAGLSFSFWFKADPSNGTWSRIFDFGNGVGLENIIVFIYGGKLGFSIYQGTNAYQRETVIPNVCDNTWRHITWTMDSSKGWLIYVNGVLTKTYSDGFYPKSMMRNYQYIGRSNWPADPYFMGCIADFRIYNTAISQTEITGVFNQSFNSGPNKNQIVSDAILVKGHSQLYNEIFCDLYNSSNGGNSANGFIKCQDCNFGDDTIVYKTTTENSDQGCLNACSNSSRCTSYSYDFSKSKDNCSQYISFPNDRYTGVKNINSGYNVSKFNYKFSDLSDEQKRNLAVKCSDQYLNNIFLPNKNIDLVECINPDNDNVGNFTMLNTDPKCVYNLYKSNGLNPEIENRINYISNPVLKISQGDEVIDNHYQTYKSFLENQVGNSNINNLLNLKNSNDSVNKNTAIPPQSSSKSDLFNYMTATSDSIIETTGTPYNIEPPAIPKSIEPPAIPNSIENFDNKSTDNYNKIMYGGIIFILFIIFFIIIFYKSKK